MIIKFKLYETINKGEPKNGDWVICKEDGELRQSVDSYLSKNIGRIKYIDNFKHGSEYNVEFFGDIPEDIYFWFFNHTLMMYREDILYWSTNKEDLEPIESFLQSNKYNL